MARVVRHSWRAFHGSEFGALCFKVAGQLFRVFGGLRATVSPSSQFIKGKVGFVSAIIRVVIKMSDFHACFRQRAGVI